MRIALVTACGKKKLDHPAQAFQLYKSARIKAVHNRKGSAEMFILSAKYGLVKADQVIEPYNQVLTPVRAQELKAGVEQELADFDKVVYFRAGARKEYLELIQEAAKATGKALVVIGFGNMGGVNEIRKHIDQ